MWRIGRTIDAIERSEASRPERMERTLAAIDRRIELDAERLERDVHVLGEYIERDFDRWEERQPLYRKVAAEKLWGDPESIPSTAIILFW